MIEDCTIFVFIPISTTAYVYLKYGTPLEYSDIRRGYNNGGVTLQLPPIKEALGVVMTFSASTLLGSRRIYELIILTTGQGERIHAIVSILHFLPIFVNSGVLIQKQQKRRKP
jgi:hypothetical protein